MPRHELARAFLAACGTPVVAPTANLSGRPSPTTWEAVYEDLDGRIDCILQGDATEIGLESTVVDCTGDRPIVLRQGSVTLEDIRKVVPNADVQRFGRGRSQKPRPSTQALFAERESCDHRSRHTSRRQRHPPLTSDFPIVKSASLRSRSRLMPRSMLASCLNFFVSVNVKD